MEPSIISEKRQFAYTLLLVHLPYSINKAITIHVLYHTWNQHCIIWVMNMRQNKSSSVSKNLLLEIHNKGWMHFCRDILMGHHREKNQRIPNYRIEKCHTSTRFDIFQNHSTYSNIFLLLEK